MATITTRGLSRKDRFDRVAVRVDAQDYVDKYGVFTVTLTDITWSSADNISADVGVVSLFPSLDPYHPYLEEFAIDTTQGTEAITKKHIAAVNNGVPGPSIRQNPDNSWDILDLVFTLPEDNDLNAQTMVLTYTLTFTDLTAAAGGSNSTITLNVNNLKKKDIGYISGNLADMVDKEGYLLVRIKSSVLTVIDQPINAPAPDPAGDYVPLFTIKQLNNIKIQHPTPKISGTRNYPDTRFVIAVNDGVGDANGTTFNSTAGDLIAMEAVLEKKPEWPCNDDVTLALTHSSQFVEIA